mmetsp:Transcript_40874/g.80225  ORF Transcript_40874/g.80225 Transcript_40874/m.80225 type:complete len:237 (-) Transcript_40874:283-993(-)
MKIALCFFVVSAAFAIGSFTQRSCDFYPNVLGYGCKFSGIPCDLGMDISGGYEDARICQGSSGSCSPSETSCNLFPCSGQIANSTESVELPKPARNSTKFESEIYAERVKECVANPSNCSLNSVKHSCDQQNPCTISISASYLNWDYIDMFPLPCAVPVKIEVENGEGDLRIGSSPGEAFSSCCEGGSCDKGGITSYNFQPTCSGTKILVSFWNKNYLEDQTWTFTFAGGKGLGPK